MFMMTDFLFKCQTRLIRKPKSEVPEQDTLVLAVETHRVPPKVPLSGESPDPAISQLCWSSQQPNIQFKTLLFLQIFSYGIQLKIIFFAVFHKSFQGDLVHFRSISS